MHVTVIQLCYVVNNCINKSLNKLCIVQIEYLNMGEYVITYYPQ